MKKIEKMIAILFRDILINNDLGKLGDYNEK